MNALQIMKRRHFTFAQETEFNDIIAELLENCCQTIERIVRKQAVYSIDYPLTTQNSISFHIIDGHCFVAIYNNNLQQLNHIIDPNIAKFSILQKYRLKLTDDVKRSLTDILYNDGVTINKDNILAWFRFDRFENEKMINKYLHDHIRYATFDTPIAMYQDNPKMFKDRLCDINKQMNTAYKHVIDNTIKQSQIDRSPKNFDP